MKSLLLALMCLSTCMVSLWAKPQAPIEMSFEQKKMEPLGEEARYECEVNFKALSSSDIVIVQMKVPDSCQLLEGFSYWEVVLESGESFIKTVIVQGSVDQVHRLNVVAKMEMGSAIAMKSLDLSLNSALEVSKAKPGPSLVPRTRPKQSGSRRSIKRE